MDLSIVKVDRKYSQGSKLIGYIILTLTNVRKMVEQEI
jgi:hypothetical protein